MASATLHFASAGGLGHQAAEHVLEIDPHLLHAGVGKNLHHGHGLFGHVQIHEAVVQLSVAQHVAQFFPGGGVAHRTPGGAASGAGVGNARAGFVAVCAGFPGSSRSSIRSSATCQALSRTASCSRALSSLTVSSRRSRTMDSTSRPTYPTSVNLEASTLTKGESVSGRQTPGDLGLADAGGADQDDVFGRDFVPEVFGHLLPAPAVAQGDGHRAFGLVLADDVLVQFLDDFRWFQVSAMGSTAGLDGSGSQLFHGHLIVGENADAGRQCAWPLPQSSWRPGPCGGRGPWPRPGRPSRRNRWP